MNEVSDREVVVDSLCDAVNSLRNSRHEFESLVTELKDAALARNSHEMIQQSETVLEKMASLVSSMRAEVKCVEYLHNTVRALDRRENA